MFMGVNRTLRTGPELWSSLGYYDDWLRVLIYHEFVHILHNDTVTGLSSFFNFFVGKRLAPNRMAPEWLIEGLAVYHESKRTPAGRLNASLEDVAETKALLMALGIWAQVQGRLQFGHLVMKSICWVEYVFEKYGEEFDAILCRFMALIYSEV